MTRAKSNMIHGGNGELWLEIAGLPEIWAQCQGQSTEGGRWRAYLNRLALTALHSWLAEHFMVSLWPNRAALPSFWEVVNGSALTVNGKRLVLIPEEALDHCELRVPQEWVDIPGWAGDYYLAFAVDLEAGAVCFWGFTTHAHLKSGGLYDTQDRSYVLAESKLFDSYLLSVSLQRPGATPLRAPLPTLSTLPVQQAHQLLSRLGSPTVIFPRLAVPFALWGALLEHGGWRQQLYERRQGLPEQRLVPDWVRKGVSEMAAQLGWLELTATASGLQAKGTSTASPTVVFSRELQVAGQPYELQVKAQHPDGVWRFQLQSTLFGGQIPRGFKLRLLTENREPFENNEIIATEAIPLLYRDVEIDPGEGLVWEVAPTPEGYDQEILFLG